MASIKLRLSWLLPALLLTACSVPRDQATSEPPLQNRRLSEFSPQLAGKPFDFRCRECDYPGGGLNSCRAIGSASMVVRATGAGQRQIAQRCDPGHHDFSTRCDVDVLLDLENPKEVAPVTGSGAPSTVAASFEYHGYASEVPHLPIGADHYLFLAPDSRVGASATHRLFAVCPRLPAIDAQRSGK